MELRVCVSSKRDVGEVPCFSSDASDRYPHNNTSSHADERTEGSVMDDHLADTLSAVQPASAVHSSDSRRIERDYPTLNPALENLILGHSSAA